MTRNMIYQDILDLISPHSLGSSKDPAGWRVSSQELVFMGVR